MINLPPPQAEVHNIDTREDFIKKILHKITDKFHESKVNITPLDKGLTKSTYLLSLPNDKYVLKILDQQKPLSKILKELWFSQMASEIGIGPKISFIDIENRAILMDYIKNDSGERFDTADTMSKLALLHKNTHYEPFSTIYKRFSKIKSPSKSLTNAIALVKGIEEKFIEDGCWPTLCHMDFHKENILTNNNIAALIDWESAGFGHPYYDIAKLTLSLEFDESVAYLKSYLNKTPTQIQISELRLMRTLVYMCIATNRYLKGDYTNGKKALDYFLLLMKEHSTNKHEVPLSSPNH